MIHWRLLDWAGSLVDHPARHGTFWACLLGVSAAVIASARVLGGPGLWRFMRAEFIDGWNEGLWFWMTMGGLLQPSTWACSERMWVRYLQALAARASAAEESRTTPVRAFLDHCHALRHGKVPAPLWKRLTAWPSWPGVLGSYMTTVAPPYHEVTREAVEAYLKFVRRSHRVR